MIDGQSSGLVGFAKICIRHVGHFRLDCSKKVHIWGGVESLF